ncbi:hypothetical protein L1987_26261 [Smallanthus sonchifolius]|uniref:Uncharacterized protein n=1 Tax=Smallanthus sonchifolius TaxID=185202 RepID=A0ACB9I8N5_9ASTR|nr:hypothetical protein L1987_26261 [Smallanthus sonchifolius]
MMTRLRRLHRKHMLLNTPNKDITASYFSTLIVNRWVRVSFHLSLFTSSGVRRLPSCGYPKFVKVLIPCKTWSKRTSGQTIFIIRFSHSRKFSIGVRSFPDVSLFFPSLTAPMNIEKPSAEGWILPVNDEFFIHL